MATSNSALPEPPDTGWFKRWVDFGALIKTALGMLLALLVGGYAAYNHFAKSDEIQALRQEIEELRDNAVCANAMENAVSLKVIDVSRQVREALRGMEAATDFPALRRELEKSVPKVDQALREMELAREARTHNTMVFKGSERCKR